MQGLQTVSQQTQHHAIHTYQQLKPKIEEHRWSLVTLTLLTLTGGTALSAIVWLSRVPPAPDCQNISVLSSDSEHLYCAQQAAQSGKPEDLLASINLVKDWPTDHPIYPQAKVALEQWSAALLMVARERLLQNNLDGAVQLAQAIPSTSPLFEESRDAIKRWQSERQRGQQLFDRLQVALKKQQWNDASNLVAKLALVDDPNWQSRLQDLRQQIDAEKKASLLLKQAQEFAKNNPILRWGQAIALTNPIDRKTYVWQNAQKQINAWRDRLFELVAQKLSQRDVAGANQVLQTVPDTIAITNDQRDLIRLAQASQVDALPADKQPLLHQLWDVMLASQSIQQIAPKSTYRSAAAELIPRFNQHMEDAVQVEIARAIASFGQISALATAVDQAQQVAQRRPRRIQAQTLIAKWRKDVQRLEDQPTLQQAVQLAQTGQLERLRAAVKLVNGVTKGRVLYSQAQAQKTTWIAQIQTIEDQPILDKARNLARSGQLGQAIEVAQDIRPGRALYSSAQNDIWGWSAELRAIADRALLAQAKRLADQGYLTKAIDAASQISGSSVTGEAQSAISQWSQEREGIWRAREAAETAASPAASPEPTPGIGTAEPEPPAPEPPVLPTESPSPPPSPAENESPSPTATASPSNEPASPSP
jgi:soluble cytochrome b562